MNTLPIVRSVSIPHFNQIESNPSQDTGLENGYERISSLTLFIPENIDIDRILEDNPPDFRYHRDCFVYILHLISSIPARKRDILKENKGYTPINRKYLQGRIHEYKRYVDYLLTINILVEDGYYIPSKKSVGLKFADSSPVLKPTKITKWPLIKNILYLHKEYNTRMTQELDYLQKWFNVNIIVDYQGVLAFLKNIRQQEFDNNNDVTNLETRFRCRLLPLLKLSEHQYAFYVDNTGFRLHTAFTQMMKGLRRFCTYHGETLCAVDITNSQLYLAISLLDDHLFVKNNIQSMITNPNLTFHKKYPIMVVDLIRKLKNESDVLRFKEWATSGSFYEHFSEFLIQEDLLDANDIELRNKTKKITFLAIYSPNTHVSFEIAIQIFKKSFPNVYKLFTLIKQGKKSHPALSVCLQRFEAELVLHRACGRISKKYPEAPIFTVHDSIVTTERYVSLVDQELHNVLEEAIGVAPQLKIERWE